MRKEKGYTRGSLRSDGKGESKKKSDKIKEYRNPEVSPAIKISVTLYNKVN